MPQDRTLLHTGDRLRVERVVMQALPAQWSPHYQVASARLVLPAQGATECRLADQTCMLDGMTVLRLPTGQAYRLKPFGAATRASIVVSAQADMDDGLAPTPSAFLLAPRALWLLRRHWRALARDPQRAGPQTSVLLQDALQQALPADQSPTAVLRAQRFIVARTDTDARWHLQDVADAACCSLFHLARSFRRHTGLSLHGYRQRLRLAVALQRLEDGERDLAGLTHDLGFSSQSHLGAAFQRGLGVTPAQARRELGC
ncbi:helix-turn-helix transcriptional regulator [Paucibacter sp. PLA-PC-4]|uniref:helix-turn-helix transcriptional regulator n=1 Tax=Paucibacter sp. PLA-PC-4 TaxID=2993655 RepID=UPI0022491261|nr:helix-turn-helix transcriptional regulator [Paucibacter sp. PLA-PC-4]MCX2863149.1 helix-turn-helix transcriptional regulator [Paucibacter sp. PLA-PC-4]